MPLSRDEALPAGVAKGSLARSLREREQAAPVACTPLGRVTASVACRPHNRKTVLRVRNFPRKLGFI